MFEYSHVYDLEKEVCLKKGKSKKYEKLKVIASWGICNTASLNVFKIDYKNNKMLVAVNDFKPEWCDIENYIDEDWKIKNLEDEYNLGIKYGNTAYFLDECLII